MTGKTMLLTAVRGLLWGCATVLCSSTLSAEPIWVRGDVNCGDWLKARDSKNSSQYEFYVVGLVNGLAGGAAIDVWGDQNRVSNDQFFFYLDKYCRDNPLSSTFTGAVAFAGELSPAFKIRPQVRSGN